MLNTIEITEFGNKALDPYVRLTGAQLRVKTESDLGIFIAESPTVIDVALDGGCVPVSLLCDKRLINSDAKRVIERCDRVNPGLPVYFAERDMLTAMTGFELTRGMLCAMRRPEPKTPEEVLKNASRVAVLEGITDSTNVGAIFRSAAAIGVDAVLLTPTCCDPLCRRAVRVSMGTVFLIPFATLGKTKEDWPHPGIDFLKSQGFHTCAMALSHDTKSVEDESLKTKEKLAIILGTEGDGLMRETIDSADDTVKIPMLHGVDSLNVAAASAVAFWELRKR
ncbi:MAG: RNA methyltransferase [Clostridia bacterium]|nr:RNA methyltransferase [Clostridia bacterium]